MTDNGLYTPFSLEIAKQQLGEVSDLVEQLKSKGCDVKIFNNPNDTTQRFVPERNARIYVSCSQGCNRSQVLLHVLRTGFRDKGYTFMDCHGGNSAFDPYLPEPYLHEYFICGQTSREMDRDYPGYTDTFQHARYPIFGQDPQNVEIIRSDPSNYETLRAMRQYFTENYYTVPYTGRQTVFISFGQGAHAVAYRLCEANRSLKGVVLVMLAYSDVVAHPECITPQGGAQPEPHSRQAYLAAAELFAQHFPGSAQAASTSTPPTVAPPPHSRPHPPPPPRTRPPQRHTPSMERLPPADDSLAQTPVVERLPGFSATSNSARPVDARPASSFATIGVRAGKFHLDDALPVVMLRMLDRFHGARVVRTNDTAILAQCTAVVGVGQMDDPDRFRYDHTAAPKQFPGTSKVMATGGRVYAHHGRDILRKRHPGLDSVGLELAFQLVYHGFVLSSDAIATADPEAFAVIPDPTTLANRIDRLCPEGTSERDLDEGFEHATAFATASFHDYLEHVVGVMVPDLRRAFDARTEHDPKGRVLVLPRSIPHRMISPVLRILNNRNTVHCVVYADAYRWVAELIGNVFPHSWWGNKDTSFSVSPRGEWATGSTLKYLLDNIVMRALNYYAPT